ncbi:VQ motif containing protein [Trema orientale]|uniref:VQ motif containing protein n=1 Tax=Trema orientale TaxID=63057 RepID=A0A2P5AQN7_TREOI|nr:VQ motif containing protein [Trema orientale]
MDNNINLLTSVHHQQRKSTKKPNKTKKTSSNKPVRVVYISNPMKVKTSASKFRALVQELTGQDAEFPDPTKFPATEDDGAVTGDPTVKMGSSSSLDLDHDGVVVEIDMSSSSSLEQQHQVESSSTANIITTTTNNNNNTSLEAFDDDVFMPQMMDSLSGILPSSVWYESPQLDAIRSSLDAIM